MWLAGLLFLLPSTSAQPNEIAPIADLITIIPSDEPFQVTIQGGSGSTPANSQIAIQNHHTKETVYTNSNFEGAFSATITGLEQTPYDIIAVPIISQQVRQNFELPIGRAVRIQQTSPREFALGGELSRGDGIWLAQGRIENTSLNVGDTMTILLDVWMRTPSGDVARDVTMGGLLELRQMINAQGVPQSSAHDAGINWSSIPNRVGLPISGITIDDLILDAVTTTRIRRDSEQNEMQFRLLFNVPVPNIENGIYTPVFTGFALTADSDPFDWYDNRFFGVSGTGDAQLSTQAMPIPITVGQVENPRWLWMLFDSLLPQDEQVGYISGSKFPSPLPIIQQGTIALNPRTLFNPYPLDMSGNTLNITITAPDETITQLSSPISQMNVVIAEDGTRTYYHSSSNDTLQFNFDQYGVYTIEMYGRLFDPTGRRYDAGGIYQIAVAEPLALYPAVLPSTPFVEGGVFNPTLRVAPALPANSDVRVVLNFFPQGDAESIQIEYTGRTNRYGYFTGENYTFETAGEYIVDYRVAGQDSNGMTYATTLRSAGIVAPIVSPIFPHGRRGLADYHRTPQAWFDTATYPIDAPNVAPILNYPYHSGDIVFIPDETQYAINPIMDIQDLTGIYSSYLQDNFADLVTERGDLNRLNLDDALPIVFTPAEPVYAYIGAVRPDGVIRQFVQGQSNNVPDFYFDNSENVNEQIGFGRLGNTEGDYIFLFGNLRLGNTYAGYASLAMVTDGDSARVVPPFTRPLLNINDTSIDTFFYPSAVRPGQVLQLGDTLQIAGYVAPLLPTTVEIEITAPSGESITFTGNTNPFGYLGNINPPVIVDQTGVWRVDIRTRFDGNTSAGTVSQSFTGTTLGNGTFEVYVVDSDADPLEQQGDVIRAIFAGQVQNIRTSVPEGWTDVIANITLASESYLMESQVFEVNGQSVIYQIQPQNINRIFPNYEANGQGDSFTDSDALILSVAVTGTNPDGRRETRARVYHIWHNTIISLD